jgi:hypothetical protein
LDGKSNQEGIHGFYSLVLCFLPLTFIKALE